MSDAEFREMTEEFKGWLAEEGETLDDILTPSVCRPSASSGNSMMMPELGFYTGTVASCTFPALIVCFGVVKYVDLNMNRNPVRSSNHLAGLECGTVLKSL